MTGSRQYGAKKQLRLRFAAVAISVIAAAWLNSLPAAAQQAGGVQPSTPNQAALRGLAAASFRLESNRVRDQFRRPYEVLAFFDIKPDSTVIEISPGVAAYWTELLAPYLRDRGLYVAANPAPTSPAAKAGMDKYNAEFAARMAADPVHFSKVKVIDFAPEMPDFAPAGSADVVLTFRNLHNWMDRGVVEKAIASFHRVLKKGGILGIKDHRGRTDQPQDPKAKTGYVRQDYAIEMIEKAGFKLLGTSEAVANPKDTKDYAAGVWALPPTYRMKDQDREKLTAIGESDRFLLKFIKL
jgi:predicted methyltransferase